MRLVYITNARLPAERANALQTVRMAAALAEAGAEVTLFYPDRRNLPQFEKIDARDYYGVPHSFNLEPVWCMDWFHLSGGNALVERPIFLWQTFTFAWALAARLRHQVAEVYYSRDLFVLTLLVLLLPGQRRHMFFEMHTFPGSGLGRWLHKAVLARIGGVVAITSILRERLITLGVAADMILVAPDGVDIRNYEGLTQEEARARLNLDKDQRLVVYTGHLYGWKGVEVLAEAIAMLKPAVYGLLVGGTPADLERMQVLLAARQWTTVRLVGLVPPNVVPLYQVAADVLALPNSARAEISRSYTSPLKLFEYMAAGRPIVASDLPSLREILQDGENALLVAPDDAGALAQGIGQILADEDLGLRLARKAKDQVRAYTWTVRAEKVLGFVNEKSKREALA
jgi:glycosyltransferase involved in cell wall biosynthesis